MPSCVVTEAMNQMNGFENDVVETAIKEATCIAFAGTLQMTVSSRCSFVFLFSASDETVIIALSCVCSSNNSGLGSDYEHVACVPSCYGTPPGGTSQSAGRD